MFCWRSAFSKPYDKKKFPCLSSYHFYLSAVRRFCPLGGGVLWTMQHFLLRTLSSCPSPRTRAAGKTHIAVGLFDEVRNHLIVQIIHKFLQKIPSANSEGPFEMLGAHFGSPDDVLHSLQISRLLQMSAGYSVIFISAMNIRCSSKRENCFWKTHIFNFNKLYFRHTNHDVQTLAATCKTHKVRSVPSYGLLWNISNCKLLTAPCLSFPFSSIYSNWPSLFAGAGSVLTGWTLISHLDEPLLDAFGTRNGVWLIKTALRTTD